MAESYRVISHAEEELKRRGILRRQLDELLANPQQVVRAFGNRKAYQSKIDIGGGKMMLLRAIVEDHVDPPVVVTVYRTSKIAKYWSAS